MTGQKEALVQRLWMVWLATAGILASGCGATHPVVSEPAFNIAAHLAAADALVARGCLDCLHEALTEYLHVIDAQPASTVAIEGATRSKLLIEVREHELGLPARISAAVPGSLDATSPNTRDMMTVAAAISGRSQDARLVLRNPNDWAQRLRAQGSTNMTAAYLWLALVCGPSGTSIPDRDDRTTIEAEAAHVPLLAYKLAVSCAFRDRAALDAVATQEPRFTNEIAYWLGLTALSGQPQINGPGGLPDLDAADAHFADAYAWRQDWPPVTLALANIALTAEDFPRATDFYDKTLALRPDDADAFIGKIRALTYQNRPADAVAAADELLTMNRNPGEARYWRAYNELQLDRLDAAWDDIEASGNALVNADVPKLAGLIAIRQHRLETARERLQLSLTRRATDCDTWFYFQAVQVEQQDWKEAVASTASAASCLDSQQSALVREIARQRGEPPSARRDRQMARREADLSSALRMRATAWFNGVVANVNIANGDEARRLAEKLTDDSQFGARARTVLQQLNRPIP
jgi:tetratricopeptide (TPR) repeat protein